MTDAPSINQESSVKAPSALVIMQTVLRDWRLILLAGMFGFVIGLLLVHILPTEYRSEAVVRPPDQGSLGAMGGIAASLGKGLLGAVGGGDLFSGADQSSFDEFSNLLDSNELSHWLASKHPEVLHHIFRHKWDSESHRWKEGGALHGAIDAIRAFLGMTPSRPPSDEDLRRYLSKEVDVSTDFKTGMVTIGYSDEDPQFARQLIAWMHEGADEIVRTKEKDRSLGRIAYLDKLLPSVTQADLHLVLATLLAQEEQKMMTIQADSFYAAWSVDAPMVAQRPSFPPVLLILISMTFLGMASMVSCLIFLPHLNLPGRAKWSARRLSRATALN